MREQVNGCDLEAVRFIGLSRYLKNMPSNILTEPDRDGVVATIYDVVRDSVSQMVVVADSDQRAETVIRYPLS